MRLGIKGLDGYPRRVVSSKALREWLKPLMKGKRQQDLAAEWGVRQPTISRFLRQVSYDVPLDTVGQIAKALGYADLSMFFLHIERNVQSHAQLTSSDTATDDKRTASNPPGVEGGHSHAPIGVSQSDIRRAVKDVLILTVAAITNEELATGTTTATAQPDHQARKSLKSQHKRGVGGR